MMNNICENHKSVHTATNFKTKTITTNVDNGYSDANNVVSTNSNGKNSGGAVMQTTYGHGIWYSELVDADNNTNNNNTIFHKQQGSNIANSSSSNNNKENSATRNAWLTKRSDILKDQQQKQQQSDNNNANNECDIIIVDIEDDDNDDEVVRQQQQQRLQQLSPYSVPSMFFMNANIKLSKQQQQQHPAIYDSEYCIAKTNLTSTVYNINTEHNAIDDHVNMNAVIDNVADIVDKDEADEDDDSLASMETLSDNVSIWIDGEKHWVAGVDALTTCSDLIWALLNYQNGQQHSQHQLQSQQHQHTFTIAATEPSTNEENITAAALNTTNSNQYKEPELLQQQQQQQPSKPYNNKNAIKFSLSMCKNVEDSSNLRADNKPNIQNTANTNNNTNLTTTSTITTTINQSMPINTKEDYKIIQNSTLSTAATTAGLSSSSAAATPFISSAPAPTVPPTLLPLTLPPGITTISQLATEYVIVKQYHHCEEYLDGSTKVFDVLPPREGSHKKECELLLRHLGPAPTVCANNTTPQLSSLISTDKDSGMGSPVGSARSAKFRRRKHKSSQWLAQANTLHPKLSRCSANERLMKIILAQDETIQQQLSLLREKERQITKIEEEKHRKRERELGKNYLLETYLNGLDEAECEPEIQDGVEIFIDEPYNRAATTPARLLTTNPGTIIKPIGVTLAAGAITDKIPSNTAAFNVIVKQKLKDKEVKKEKKKKRHKEKLTKDDVIQAKDLNLKINTNKDKAKEVDKQQHKHQAQQQRNHELEDVDGNSNKDNGNEQEIEMQILWLEKIYSLNKQLQKEEELAAKLHAKVRKHQLRKSQQTQREAQMEIDKLDNNLALQCGDIRKIEANLMQTNEQLQKKLLILERLSMEYLQEQQERKANIMINAEEQTQTKETENSVENNNHTLITNLEKSTDINKLSLNNIKSKEEAIKLERIIAKPSIESKDTKHVAIDSLMPNTTASFEANNPLRENTNTEILLQINKELNQRFLNDSRANSMNSTLNSMNQNIVVTTADNQQQQKQQFVIPATTAQHILHSEETMLSDTMSTPCMFVDKNMLSSLHVQNAKTIKKQMFHTHTTSTTTTTTTTITAAGETSAAVIGKILKTSSLSHPPPLPPQPQPITSAFPKQKFSQISQHHMPMASSYLTSRPQNSHQKLATNNVLLQQPSTASANFEHSSAYNLTSTLTSSSSSPLPSSLLSPATVSVLKTQQPLTSVSPSPSIVAMNTVDISQLGTLV